MRSIHGNGMYLAVIRTIRLLLLFALLAAPAYGETLELQLEAELGRLPAPSDEAAVDNLLPVILGVTNLRHRLDRAVEDVTSWQQTNEALATHVLAREEHMLDLQAFVERQDGTIEILTRQSDAMRALKELPAPSVVAMLPTTSASQSAPPASQSFYAVALSSPFIETGLILVIVALLAWTLYLRGQVRSREQVVTARPGPPRNPRVAVDTGDLGIPDVAPMGSPEGLPVDGKDMVELLHDYDRAAAALVTSVGAGPVPEEHRLRLKRALAGVAKKEEFLAEASALADDASPEEAHAGQDEMHVGGDGSEFEDLANKTLIMAPLDLSTRATQAPTTMDTTPPVLMSSGTQTNTAVLKEVDTLIAFENYERASELLNQLLDEAPTNPEYRLRLLHILSAAGEAEATAEQEEILAAMMDGPLSETLARVRSIGRDLLPGHPLFTSAKPTPVAVADDEIIFDADSVFDITFSDDGGKPIVSDFDPLGDEATMDAPQSVVDAPVVDDLDTAEEDLDDFMQSAFDDSPSGSDATTAEGEDDFGLSIDLDNPHDDTADIGPSFYRDPSDDLQHDDRGSVDIDDEFDALLEEMRKEDAQHQAGGSDPIHTSDEKPHLPPATAADDDDGNTPR